MIKVAMPNPLNPKQKRVNTSKFERQMEFLKRINGKDKPHIVSQTWNTLLDENKPVVFPVVKPEHE